MTEHDDTHWQGCEHEHHACALEMLASSQIALRQAMDDRTALRGQLTVARIATVHAVACYFYQTSPMKFVEDVYGKDHVESYIEEKAAGYARSYAYALGQLDEAHFSRFVETAWARYGAEGLRRAELQGRPHYHIRNRMSEEVPSDG